MHQQTFQRKATSGERETRSCTLSVKAVGDGGEIEGYASVFGVLDTWADIISVGAFAATIKAHKAAGTMPAMLWQHDGDDPIGVWSEMTEDASGLKIKGRLCLDTACGKEAHALLKMGAINGLSVGFVTKAYEYDTETDVRTITEVDLWEVSLVTFPANSKARVTSVKSSNEIQAPKDAERILRDAGFSKSDATGFVSRVMRMGEDRSDSAKSTAIALQAASRLIQSLTNS
jgi:HK97 family phage prohead protease